MKGNTLCGFLALCLAVLRVGWASCPNGWMHHGEFCFDFKRETYNWFDAQNVCHRLGGYLAEDTSPAKHQYLTGVVEDHRLSNNMTWIGLQDFAEENLFVWDHSGQPVETTCWGPGEPQDYLGEEDCVALHHGQWDDLNCEDFHVNFICEKAAVEDALIG